MEWRWETKGAELYQFLLPLLNSELGELVSQVDEENGFELYRRMAEEKDEVADDIDFQIEAEIGETASHKCKDLKATKDAVVKLGLKAKE